MPFEIDDNASITMAPPSGEIVNADHAWSIAGVVGQSPGSPANVAQQRVPRTRRRQSGHHALTRPATQRNSDRMYNLIASCRSATVSSADLAADIFAERRAATARRGATKPSHGQQDRNCPTANGKIRQRSDMAAVAGPRQRSAIGTAGLDRSKTTADANAVGADVLMFNNNAGRNQAQPLDRSAHEKSGLQRPTPLSPRMTGATRSNLHEK